MSGQSYSLDKACKSESGIFVEVGTWTGNFSRKLLERTNCKILYCVDPYKHFEDDTYPDAINNISQSDFDNVFEKTKKSLECFGSRVEFIRSCSVDAVKLFEDESVDYIYIDGNHDYKFVEEDIRLWYPKLKKGGYFCGDDVYCRDLSQYDSDNNVTMIWTRNDDGTKACWGKYGTYPACLINEKLYNIKFVFEDNQFSCYKI